mgnify:CR=1 FL=1
MAIECNSLAEVRGEIDRIDGLMLALLAERGDYVRQAARFKRDAAEVPAPKRVEAVVARVCEQARALGADPAVAEATWRAMIAAFIQSELAAHAALHPPST